MASDRLMCIYPVSPVEATNLYVDQDSSGPVMRLLVHTVECGYDAPEADRHGRSQLVVLQEHLRDEHLKCSTTQLQDVLRRTVRRVTHPNGTIGLVTAEQEWQEQPYRQIEWMLPSGHRWLRAEKVDGGSEVV